MNSALLKTILKYLKFSIAIIICSYVLLRGFALYQYQPISFDGDYFSFNDKEVGYKCTGNGEHVVFFESGFGADSEESWEPIINALPEHVTACYYDRLGHGGSDDVPTDFTTDQKSQLQESLIKHIAGERPVILVAKSYGGIISRRTLGRANLLEPAHASTPHTGQFQPEQSKNLDSGLSNINFLAVIFLDSAHENQHTILRGKFEPISDFVKNAQYVNAALGLTAIKNIFK
ncbi:alpha/beta hydrolase, partial [Psychrosphaera sp.]|nr:alpha/beta hydrolase [Psychrosphaera sp.]